MRTVTSRDGTTIAFDHLGKGPALILVGGAFEQRAMDSETAQLAALPLLAQHLTVFQYDRRGRGDSTDTQPYAVEREVEDIEALLNEAGGSAFVYGTSSGAALAFEAALALGGKVKKLAMYEAPYNDDDDARQRWRHFRRQLSETLAEGRRGDAVGLFMICWGCLQTTLMRCASIPCGRCGQRSRPRLPTMPPSWERMPRYPPSEQPVLLCRHSSWPAGRAIRSCGPPQRRSQTRPPTPSTAPWRVRRTRSLRRRLGPCWWSSSIPAQPSGSGCRRQLALLVLVGEPPARGLGVSPHARTAGTWRPNRMRGARPAGVGSSCVLGRTACRRPQPQARRRAGTRRSDRAARRPG
jgi:pimeloyl-ACP methyl ester carboxylesterase